MPGLVDSLERLFKTKDLYEILGLPSDSKSSLSGAQIKKAYHKKSLVYHPDRVAKEENRPEATEKFQCLGKKLDRMGCS